MIPADIADIAQEGLLLGLLLVAPVVAALLLSGLLTGVLSRVTRMSEPAVTFAARFSLVSIALLATAPWIARRLLMFSADIWSLVSAAVS